MVPPRLALDYHPSDADFLTRIDEWMIPPPATPARYQKWMIVFVRCNRIEKLRDKQSDKSIVQYINGSSRGGGGWGNRGGEWGVKLIGKWLRDKNRDDIMLDDNKEKKAENRIEETDNVRNYRKKKYDPIDRELILKAILKALEVTDITYLDIADKFCT
ncbi:hypothetical protein Tco_0270192 [Tanacetum coccineum]